MLTTRPVITAQEAHTKAQIEAATAPQVRPAATLNFDEASHKPVFTLVFFPHFSGSQNQKKGMRGPKMPKHNASWGEALAPPHANAWDCDEYSLPMEMRYGQKKTHVVACLQQTQIHTDT